MKIKGNIPGFESTQSSCLSALTYLAAALANFSIAACTRNQQLQTSPIQQLVHRPTTQRPQPSILHSLSCDSVRQDSWQLVMITSCTCQHSNGVRTAPAAASRSLRRALRETCLRSCPITSPADAAAAAAPHSSPSWSRHERHLL